MKNIITLNFGINMDRKKDLKNRYSYANELKAEEYLKYESPTIDNLWPTPIWKFEINDPFILNTYKQYIIEESQNKKSVDNSNVGTWQSEANYQTEDVFDSLTKTIMGFCKNHVNSNFNYEITAFWLTVSPKGTTIHVHHHAHNTLAGIFFVDKELNKDGIGFIDPRTRSSMANPYTQIITDSTNKGFFPSSGFIFIFPGWLETYMLTNTSDRDNILITFNINCH